ncbi:hydrogenase nickel incorporation protein HypB [Streptomyces oceani]|uniref:Ni/Fe hydrogenase formation protein n=1 Tax=Streptomyces oceani TaxID=1075402 RepID=A0A1E7JMK5_9ACTN|nr:hydrogenase nickel incorporation protein HypB [Streptomyces oceani]OEU89094.1 Ni/Fe hydrogenase formation protein [Streptomyces oceani]
MCRVDDLKHDVLAQNNRSAQRLRRELTAGGTTLVNLLSSPGSGKTQLLEAELTHARRGGVPVAAVTADLATENDAERLARSGAPVKQAFTDGLCHLEADMLGRCLTGWLPAHTRVLFVENVGNLVCPASYDLGESLRIALCSVTEGEDKPLKYPSAFGLAHLVVVTKSDIATAVGFDESAFRANVQQVNPGVEIVRTSARTGEGTGELLRRALAVRAGETVHQPVLASGDRTTQPAQPHTHEHAHERGHQHDHGTQRHADAHS